MAKKIEQKSDTQKVNIRTPANLSIKFTELAKEKGCVKSKLLRSWIRAEGEVFTTIHLPQTNKNVDFSLTLLRQDYDKVKKNVKKFQLSINAYLTKIVYRHVLGDQSLSRKIIQKAKVQSDFNAVWDAGELGVVHQDYLDLYQELTIEQQLKLLRATMEAGYFAQAQEVLETFKNDAKKNASEWAAFHAMRYESFYLIHQKRDFQQAQQVTEAAWEYGKKTRDRTLLGSIALKKSEIAVFKSKIDEADVWLQQAVNYLDPITHPYYFIAAKLATARNMMRQSEYEKLELIFGETQQLLEVYPNKHLLSQLHVQRGLLLYSQKKYALAQNHLQTSQRLTDQIGSPWMEIHVFQVLGRVAFAQRRFDEAEKYFSLAQKRDVTIRPHFKYGRSLLLSSLPLAHTNYEYAMNTVQTIQHSKVQIVEPAVFEYVSAAIKYSYGTKKDIVAEGYTDLLKLTHAGVYQLIKDAAVLTLQTKVPGPFM